MQKALVIGAANWVGSHLIEHMQREGKWSVTATKMVDETWEWCGSKTDVQVENLDVTDAAAVRQLIKKLHPAYIFHLAEQSSVLLAWENPCQAVDVNIKGTLHVLEAVRGLYYQPRILLVGCEEEYGFVEQREIPVREETRTRPNNLYSLTKTCQSAIGTLYAETYGMDIMNARTFNYIGPGQPPSFVVSDFCKQVAEIENKHKVPLIRVGNISVKRDYTDVRDVVRAYTKLMEHGIPGETYNVGSGAAVSIHEIVKTLISQSKLDITIEIDKTRLQMAAVPVMQADVSKIFKCCGWKAEILLEETLNDMLNVWRGRGDSSK